MVATPSTWSPQKDQMTAQMSDVGLTTSEGAERVTAFLSTLSFSPDVISLQRIQNVRPLNQHLTPDTAL